MRYVLAALLLLACPLGLAAQTPPPTAPPPSIGLPLPPIGLPLPPIGLQPSNDLTTDEQHRPRHPHRDGPPFWPRQPIIFFGAPYAFGFDESVLAPTPGIIAEPAPEPRRATTGRLQLDVEPAELAQVFVDGEYVGTPADIGAALTLAPGTWRLEIRAKGYDSEAFDVRIVAGGTVTYRTTLARSTAAPEEPTAPASPVPAGGDTFYLIPGCYLGNVPPEKVKLPPGCDLSRVIVHRPSR
jgi:hypothetical protein